MTRHALGATALLVAAGSLIPLVYLVIRAFERGPDPVIALLTRPRTAELALATVVLVVIVTALSMVVGVALAWLTTRTDLPGRRGWAIALAAPLAIPSYVSGYVWIADFAALAGLPGAVLVLTTACYPLVMLPVAAALSTGDAGTVDVARTLGHSVLRTTLTVEMRRVWPAAAAGGLLAALYTMSDFGAVALMRYEAFTIGVYSAYRGGFDRTAAAVLGMILVVLAVSVTLLERRVRRGATARVGSGVDTYLAPITLRGMRSPALLVVVSVVAVGVIYPAVGLVGWMVRSLRRSLDVADVLATTAATVQLSAIAAIVVAVLAFPVALFAARSTSTAARFAESATYVAHGLPGITIALAMVFVGIRLLPGVYQTQGLLIIAYAVLFLPLAVGSTRAAIAASPVALEEVSRTLGRGGLSTTLRVTLPIAAPGMIAGAALVFVTVAKELPATLMLRPRGVDTLATELWSTTQVLRYGEAAPYALALIAVSAVPTLLLTRVMTPPVHRARELRP
ncbi:iron ABC transporter permease [Williamsia sp. CHRR-6]|uniref:ABC transporter permease n=1 Tax=Williamsia sp. CHRR-6 TaxID=2835871 RepID=UPI001BD99162|nr:iron ABC transporter permease [Williamsia sp. CHRR-6]MBT0567452.1 iron ABC transporter permease [Williamsia sp. CHRR-6]